MFGQGLRIAATEFLSLLRDSFCLALFFFFAFRFLFQPSASLLSLSISDSPSLSDFNARARMYFPSFPRQRAKSKLGSSFVPHVKALVTAFRAAG